MRVLLLLALLAGCEDSVKITGYESRNITVTVSQPTPEVRYVPLPPVTRTITVPIAVPITMNPPAEAR